MKVRCFHMLVYFSYMFLYVYLFGPFKNPFGSFYFVGDPPNPRCLRPECEFAIGLPEMKWRPSRSRGVQGDSGRVVCDIPIGRDDTGRSAV